jgi:hypothetical protein
MTIELAVAVLRWRSLSLENRITALPEIEGQSMLI